MAKIATFVRKLDDWRSDAQLYSLSESIGYDYDWDTKEHTAQTNYVVISAVIALGTGPETYIFPADEDGNVLDWGELEGSFRGALNHKVALHNAGYEMLVKDNTDA